MQKNKLARQVAFFGDEGQRLLSTSNVVVIGVGGVGSHIVQQLAYLDVRNITIVDDDVLEDTNCNRLIGVNKTHELGMPKVEIMKEYAENINEDCSVIPVKNNLRSVPAFNAIKSAGFVFSCVDNDGARLVVNELCLAYELPFLDVASDIIGDGTRYGGRVISVVDKSRCLYCLDQIDQVEARRFLQHPDAAKDEKAIYGVERELLVGGGPSVVSINGVVASLAVTEFMVRITGLRNCAPFLSYHGNKGVVLQSYEAVSAGCYYCQQVRGRGVSAEIERYIL